ncbi:MAG: hypothetical protein RMI45_03005 [Ignisphaera sp.]|nr:hypothetical protein [Ignisphaera sp.]
MLLKLIAFESLGVRSQATYVQTSDASVIIDPSAALAPRRYNLPPHRIEALRLLELFENIDSLIKDSEYIVITHYHYDHHDPGRFIDADNYTGKRFLIKDPQQYINFSQKVRANRFLSIVRSKSRDIKVVDGRTINIGRTQLQFSHPLPHGENQKLGYVLSLCIRDEDYAVLLTSDIEGGPSEEHLQLLKICSPRIAIIDGPPTYLLNYTYSTTGFEKSLQFLKTFSKITTLETIVLDHHICRELGYLDKILEAVQELTRAGKKIYNAAEFMNVKAQFLEAQRRELYNREPVSGIEILRANTKTSIKELGDAY